MKNFKLNKKGQFTIIAALLVAVILVAAVMTTYSSIRYSDLQEQPQMLSAIDEVNLALKKILGFTVGYYGSVLQVTGNTSYAKILASNYLRSGLDNIADIRPEWAPSFTVIDLDLRTNWFTNTSYSSGNFTIKYSLEGVGVENMTYSVSSRLDAQVLESSSINQAKMYITSDNEPLVDLGKANFKFYKYIFSNSTWEFVLPDTEPVTYMNGIYLVDLPSGMNSSYVVEIEDTRGLMTVASAFSQFDSKITWNSTQVEQGFTYADNTNPVLGSHSDFSAQQAPPDSAYDSLREAPNGFANTNDYPDYSILYGSTALSSGTITNLQSNDQNYLQLDAYPSAFSTSTNTFGSTTQGGYYSTLDRIRGARFTCTTGGYATSINAYLSYTSPSYTFGNTAAGGSSQSIINTIRGQRFTTPSSAVFAQSVSAYLDVENDHFGYTETGSNYESIENIMRGSSFTCTASGSIQSITAYIYTSTDFDMKAAIYNHNTNQKVGETTEITVHAGSNWVTFTFSSPKTVQAGTTYVLVVGSESRNGNNRNAGLYYHTGSTNQGHYQSISYSSFPNSAGFQHNSREYCIYANYTPTTHNVKAAIYSDTNPPSLIASSQETAVTDAGLNSFNFDSPVALASSTNYLLVVWAQSGDGDVNLCYSSSSGGNGRTYSATYGSWPSTPSFSNSNYQYCIYCTYKTACNVQAAIYSSNGAVKIGVSEEKTITDDDSLVTFNLPTQPLLLSGTAYVLVVWASDTSNVKLYYSSGSAEAFQGSGTYNNWPSTISDQGSQRNYNIYCTYLVATKYTAQTELIGSCDSTSLSQLTWSVDGSVTAGPVDYTVQLYDFSLNDYSTSGSGYIHLTNLGTVDSLQSQVIAQNPGRFQNSSGYWKIMITANSTTAPFDLRLDLVQFTMQAVTYGINIEEQWTNVDSTNLRQDLCIKTGVLNPSEALKLQINQGGSWINLMTLSSGWNNVSLASYIDSSTLTIRFVGSNEVADVVQNTWDIDSIFVKPQADIDYLISLQESTFTVELLQNGTMRWLGQNLVLTREALPIPPVPVKALHVNQTFVNGTNKEVLFQIEDWASDYQIPLGLTNNQTVFSNRQMIVFLIDNQVTDFTIWWDGSDNAAQTAFAYTNYYFHDVTNTYNNGKISLSITDTNKFTIKTQVIGHTTSSLVNFMRVNDEESTYGAGSANIICNGTVRDIIQQEAEWSSGIDNCPNVYANIVLTLPAGVSYYTYQLRLMYIDSSRQRIISDICPISLSTSGFTSTKAQTENGTLQGFPIIQDGTGLFYNYTGGDYAAHHWSQLINDNGQGVGLMFTDSSNMKLYSFDSMSGSTSKGALDVGSASIELVPVSQASVSFKTALDIAWSGAVVSFDGTTPICTLRDSTTPSGLWILAEYPPTITATAKC